MPGVLILISSTLASIAVVPLVQIAVNIAGRKTVIVVSVNAGYFDFARNLMCSIKAHDT